MICPKEKHFLKEITNHKSRGQKRKEKTFKCKLVEDKAVNKINN